MTNVKPKKLSKKVEKSHEKAYTELHKMANQQNNKILGIGETKVIKGGIYTKYDIGTSKKQLSNHAEVMIELGRIQKYHIIEGKYGYELWGN